MKEKGVVWGAFTGAFGALLAAGVASFCCLGPVVLAVLGMGGATAGAFLAPYRWFFLIGAVALLSLGFWLVYRPVKSAEGAACPPRAGRPVRVILWTAAVLTLGAAVLPSLLTPPGGAAAEYISLGREALPLREAFNADAGKVRVVMLLSPS